MRRLLWPLWLMACALFVALPPTMWAAPIVEVRFWPVRVDQRIQDVVRTADRLCWTWSSDKVRDLVSDNMDVFLTTRTDRMVVAVFERGTSLPWGRSRAVGMGHHDQAYCLLLPPNLGPSDPIRVEQVAYYPGLLGLWHIAVRFPDIVDPPGIAVP